MPRPQHLARGVAPTFAILGAVPARAGGQGAQPDSVLLVRAGRLFDSGRGVLLPARDILVRGGIVAAVDARLAVPAGARAAGGDERRGPGARRRATRGHHARGAHADPIAVEGDPTVEIGALERVRFVVKGGAIHVRAP